MIVQSLPEDWTDIQLLRHIKDHLIEQGEQSASTDADGDELCRYRLLKDGKVLACAVGCLIPDKYYSEELEGASCGNICTTTQNEDLHRFLAGHIEVLSKAQYIHDKYSEYRIFNPDTSFAEYIENRMGAFISKLEG